MLSRTEGDYEEDDDMDDEHYLDAQSFGQSM